MKHEFKAILCDMDGTIVNTEDISHKSYQLVCNKFGKSFTEELHRDIMGTTSDMWSKYLVDTMKLPISPDEFKKLCAELEHDLIQNEIKLVDGFLTLVAAIKRSDIRFVLVTSSRSASVERNLKLLNIQDPFDAWVTADIVKHGKPDPEPFLLGAQKAGVEPFSCIAIEDSLTGAKSASAAGTCVFAVPGRYSKGSDFSIANEIFDNLGDCANKVDLILNGKS